VQKQTKPAKGKGTWQRQRVHANAESENNSGTEGADGLKAGKADDVKTHGVYHIKKRHFKTRIAFKGKGGPKEGPYCAVVDQGRTAPGVLGGSPSTKGRPSAKPTSNRQLWGTPPESPFPEGLY